MRHCMMPGLALAAAVAILVNVSRSDGQTLPGVAASAPATSPATRVANSDDSVRQALARRVTVDFEGKKLSDFLHWLREEAGVNVHTNWPALYATEVKPDSPITISLTEVTYAKLLDIVFQDLSTTSKIMYVIDDGVIKISTKDEIGKVLIGRVIDISELFIDPVELSVLCGKPQGPFCDPEEPTVDPQTPVECFMETIRRGVDHDSWTPNGEGGIRRIMGNYFLVVQTPWNLDAVESLLNEMRTLTEESRVNLGIAVVRYAKPEDRKAVAQTIEKATDMQAALRAGEEAGKWSLDRCRLYDTMLNRRVECYRSSVNDGSVNKPGLELTHPGYFIEAIPKFARLGVITIALKHASGWQLPGAKDKPGTVETSRESLHLRIKRGAFEMIDIAPANAKDGGLTMVIWLPEKRNAATQPALLDAAVRNVFWWHPYSRD